MALEAPPRGLRGGKNLAPQRPAEESCGQGPVRLVGGCTGTQPRGSCHTLVGTSSTG